MDKREITARIAENSGLDERQVEAVLDTFAEVVKDALGRGENVRLKGFGEWSAKRHHRLESFNPMNGEPMVRPAFTQTVFRARFMLPATKDGDGTEGEPARCQPALPREMREALWFFADD